MFDQSQKAHICTLNNTAIGLLHQDDFQGAIVQLREALGVAQREFRSCSEAGSGTRQDVRNDTRQDMISIVKVESSTRSNGTDTDINVFCFYDRAFSFEAQSSEELGLDLICYIVLYNIGLSYHSMQTSEGLNLARTFYDMALSIATKDTASDHGIDNMCKNLFLLAALNNSGHVQSHFVNVDGMRQCLRFMQLLPVQGSGDKYCNEFDFFVHHTLAFQTASSLIIAAPEA